MQVRQIAWVQSFLALAFHNPTDHWALVISAGRGNQRHLFLGFALEQLFD